MKTIDKGQLAGRNAGRENCVDRKAVFLFILFILLFLPIVGLADSYYLDIGDKKYLYSNTNYLPSGAAVTNYGWECNSPQYVRIVSGATSSSCQIEVVDYFSGPAVVSCTIYYTQLRGTYMYSGYCMGGSHTIWINQPPEYTVTLDPQGGTVYPKSITVRKGETYGELPTPTRDGYIFEHWYYVVSSYEYAIIGETSKIKKNADHTLYADWTAANYTIKFNGNGSTGGSMSNMTCSTNTSYSLSPNRYTYTGRIFDCWNTKSDGSGTSYTDGESVRNLASAGGSITLYAIWKSADKQIPQCDVTLGTSSYTYNGSEKTPSVSIRDGKYWLIQGTDYTLAYQNNTNAGTASVTVTGIGQYSSSKTLNFTIRKADQTVSASIDADLKSVIFQTANSLTDISKSANFLTARRTERISGEAS